MLLVVVFSLLSAVEAGQRSLTFQVSATAQHLIIEFGEPVQKNYWFIFSTQLSEFVVVDVDCGEPATGCAAYCSDPRFSNLYCSFLCQPLKERASALNCGDEYYNSTMSNMSVLVDGGNWTKKLYNVRPLQGRIYSDRMRLNQYWRWERPRMDRIRIFEAPFVSALLYDRRFSSIGSPLFGLRPGPNSAALAVLNGLGAQRHVVSFTTPSRGHFPKHFIDIADLYVTFGSVDNFRCVDWEWLYAPEFVAVADRVDFMGVEFRNVLVTFDLTSFYYSIPQRVADILVDARVLEVASEEDGLVHYSYIAGRDKFIQFRSTSGLTFLQIGHQVDDFDESPIVVNPVDISSDPRADQLIFSMGATLLEQCCLAYDYTTKQVGFAQRRPWSHPLLTWVRNDDNIRNEALEPWR